MSFQVEVIFTFLQFFNESNPEEPNLAGISLFKPILTGDCLFTFQINIYKLWQTFNSLNKF